MKRKDLCLLALAAAEGAQLSPVQLQKSLFLITKASVFSVEDTPYNFEPYDYGPFDSAVYSDVETLASEGLAGIAPAYSARWNVYHVTQAGEQVAREISAQIDQSYSQYVRELVGWVRALSFSQLVKAIYSNYPEYKANSVFQEPEGV